MAEPPQNDHVPIQHRDDSTSEGEHEKPVREQLKKTSIATMASSVAKQESNHHNERVPSSPKASSRQPSLQVDEGERTSEGGGECVEEREVDQNSSPRGRRPRKRSFDDSELDEAAQSKDRGSRKRSRDTSEERKTDSHSAKAHYELPGISSAELETQIETQINGDNTEIGRPATPTKSQTSTEDGELGKKSVLSPKKKRSRDQLDKEADAETEVQSEDASEVVAAARPSRSLRDEPEKKRYRDASQEASKEAKSEVRSKVHESKSEVESEGKAEEAKQAERAEEPVEEASKTISDDVASNSAASKAEKVPEKATEKPAAAPQTSPSAFANSGFSALAGSSASPFGALNTAKPSGGGFGGFGGGENNGKSPFAAPTGGPPTSVFGGGASGFGKLGAGGPSVFGKGADFSSKGPRGIVGLDDKATKPFGAPAGKKKQKDDEGSEGDEEDEEDNKSEPEALGEGKDTDIHVFDAKEVETGEEGEETLFQSRAKLFAFSRTEKQWKERGLGTLKLNAPKGGSSTSPAAKRDNPPSEKARENGTNKEETESQKKVSARLIMRAEGVLRVVLNMPIYQGMIFGDHEGNAPAGKIISTIGNGGGSEGPQQFQIRFGSNALALELHQKVEGIKEQL